MRGFEREPAHHREMAWGYQPSVMADGQGREPSPACAAPSEFLKLSGDRIRSGIYLVGIDVLERFRDRLFLRFLEQLLKLCLEYLRFVLFRFGKLLVFFVAPRGFLLEMLSNIFHVRNGRRLGRQFVTDDSTDRNIDRQNRITARTRQLNRGLCFLRHTFLSASVVVRRV